ncbi:hypothetical protein [Streptomyces sp. t39]|uniref:hypothetical protein n=1 Tax=Streptomyces sp. t39 TaxID=1828156 RepID=UPI0011CE26CD|nr:hypothetical protein [Streptomyces sp. t39]TXS56808.1 hypothetical protein EAO77_12380 [Streptomyces sp. t39]
MDQDRTPHNGHDADSERQEPGGTVCSSCGTVAEGPPPTWTFSLEEGVPLYLCEECARVHIRAIEGRLDSSWW